MGDKIPGIHFAKDSLGFAVFGGKGRSLSGTKEVFGSHRHFDPARFRQARGEPRKERTKAHSDNSYNFSASSPSSQVGETLSWYTAISISRDNPVWFSDGSMCIRQVSYNSPPSSPLTPGTCSPFLHHHHSLWSERRCWLPEWKTSESSQEMVIGTNRNRNCGHSCQN